MFIIIIPEVVVVFTLDLVGVKLPIAHLVIERESCLESYYTKVKTDKTGKRQVKTDTSYSKFKYIIKCYLINNDIPLIRLNNLVLSNMFYAINIILLFCMVTMSLTTFFCFSFIFYIIY